MKKETIIAAAFLKKTYAQPQMRVVDIEEESLICQSQLPSAQNEEYEEESEVTTYGWFN